MSYSIIIKNGTVLDGKRDGERYSADIAIKDGKITEIGDLKKQKAGLVIDASELYVSPGFIDITTHSDTHWTLFSDPLQESFIRQGITTIIGGHGGSSLAPFLKKDALENLGRWTDLSKININWQTFEELFNELSKHDLGVNFGSFVGHENLRRNILGDKTGPATKSEIKDMETLLEQSLEAGALGLSTNLGTPQTREIPNEEIIQLLKIIKKYNAVSSHHLEDEGKNILPAISRLVMLLRGSGAAGHISHFKAIGKTAWENFGNALNIIELAQKDGVRLTCDFFPYTSTGSALASLLPEWIFAKNNNQIIKVLDEKNIRSDLIEYFKGLTLHYEKIIITSAPKSPSSIGKNLEEISRNSGLTPEEIILDLLQVNNLQVSIFNEAISADQLDLLSQKTYSMISSDGVGYSAKKSRIKKDLPHPRSYGAFPRVFSQFVKNKSILSWEEAIYKMTALPAQVLGIKNRGTLQKDNYADIVLFNPAVIKDSATYDNPFQHPKGIEYVFINGDLTYERGKMKEKGAGKIIRKE